MGDAKSHVMSYTYHPNSAYGETEPVYNTLFRRFAEEDIDLNLQDTLPYIKRLRASQIKNTARSSAPMPRPYTAKEKRRKSCWTRSWSAKAPSAKLTARFTKAF